MTQTNDETERVRRFYDRTAKHYDGSIKFFEKGRRWVCSPAHGDVLEIAAGTGRNPVLPRGCAPHRG